MALINIIQFVYLKKKSKSRCYISETIKDKKSKKLHSIHSKYLNDYVKF